MAGVNHFDWPISRRPDIVEFVANVDSCFSMERIEGRAPRVSSPEM